MDTFEEIMQKMASMSDAERREVMEKNQARCVCAKCPTYDDCSKGKGELLYCVTGKSSCTLSKTGCICPTCPVTQEIGLKHAYYCTAGSESEIRKK
jgi:hypothetical protein